MTEVLSRTLPLVAVSGWGMPIALLEPLLQCWPGLVHRIALDDTWVQPGQSPDQALAAWMERLPAQACWLGWSLGGQLAMRAAQHWPERVCRVLTLCASPRFVAAEHAPGVSADTFAAFQRDLQQDAPALLRRFRLLMLQGDAHMATARRQLREHGSGESVSLPVLAQTLAWLNELDEREFWAAAGPSRWHLFGGQDVLVPPQNARWCPAGSVYQLDGMAHWPHAAWLDALHPVLSWLAEGSRSDE